MTRNRNSGQCNLTGFTSLQINFSMETVLILGASSDIGIAVADLFASRKYDIQLAGRNEQQLIPLKSDLEIRYQVKAAVYPFDATRFETHQAFYDGLPVKPAIVICIFGYMTENEKAFTSWAEAERTINTNYTGAVSVLNIIARDFASRQKGIIAGVSSVAGERGRQSNFIYGSAKAGFTAYLSGLRNYLYHSNVHVLTILPGFVATKMTAGLSLPPLLTATPQKVAADIYNAVQKKKNILYTKWFWKWIMMIIKGIPESMFKKKKL